MDYPKRIMNRKELASYGFPDSYLMRSYSTPGQAFAWLENPLNKHSPIMFDTAGLEKWRLEDCKMQEQARKMRTTVA